MCPLRWTSKSTRNLADALGTSGDWVSADTVGRLLAEMGYSLQATAKQREGVQHEDRDAQFVYLSGQVAEHLRGGDPVISVDSKKKEVLGQRAWYSPASFASMLTRHDHPNYEFVIVVAEAATYRALHDRTADILARVDVRVWFVWEDGGVEVRD